MPNKSDTTKGWESDTRVVLGTQQGRRFFWQLLEDNNFFDGVPQGEFQCGVRAAYATLWANLGAVAPELRALMVLENMKGMPPNATS